MLLYQIIKIVFSVIVYQFFYGITIDAQSPFGHPYLGLQYNPYTSPLWGYGLGPQYGSLFGSLASNYLYGGVGPFGGVPAYAGYPGGYGIYGSFGALGMGTHGVVNAYKNYYGYNDFDEYKARTSEDVANNINLVNLPKPSRTTS